MEESTPSTTTALPSLSQPIVTNRQIPSDPAAAAAANGHANNTTSPTPPNPQPYIPQILPSGIHPLSGISLRSQILGLTLGLSTSLTIYLLFAQQTPLWRAPFFLATLSLFHFLEFYITALYNTPLAKTDAFLLSQNGRAYNAAHTLALLETVVVHYFRLHDGIGLLNRFSSSAAVVGVGCGMLVVGQGVRSVAMAHAGTNFNHTVQWRRNKGHELVTGGVYGWLRHPSYFGFFWWGLGTQVVLGNVLCFVAYAGILWKFFQTRVQSEFFFFYSFFFPIFVSVVFFGGGA